MDKNTPECMRCGHCCRNTPMACIPKTEKDDLSKSKIDELVSEGKTLEEIQKYLSTRIVFPSGECKWLDFDKEKRARCKVYSHRSSNCSDYRNTLWCNIGFLVWRERKEKGEKIPKNILDIIKRHPWYAKW